MLCVTVRRSASALARSSYLPKYTKLIKNVHQRRKKTTTFRNRVPLKRDRTDHVKFAFTFLRLDFYAIPVWASGM